MWWLFQIFWTWGTFFWILGKVGTLSTPFEKQYPNYPTQIPHGVGDAGSMGGVCGAFIFKMCWTSTPLFPILGNSTPCFKRFKQKCPICPNMSKLTHVVVFFKINKHLIVKNLRFSKGRKMASDLNVCTWVLFLRWILISALFLKKMASLERLAREAPWSLKPIMHAKMCSFYCQEHNPYESTGAL